MIKLSFKRKLFLDKKVRKKHIKRTKEHRNSRQKLNSSSGNRLQIHCPSTFSLTNNYKETVSCIQKLRTSSKSTAKEIELYNIDVLEPAAALVLAAELDRYQRITKRKLRPIKIRKWKSTVLNFLYDLGLFELLDISAQDVKKALKRKQPPKTISHHPIVLRFISHEQNEKELTDKLCIDVQKMIEEHGHAISEKEKAALSVALAEASLNCCYHAYPENEEIKRWWAAATYDRKRGIVRYFVYDQGIGIADSLKKKKLF